jgi:hypothetical protein
MKKFNYLSIIFILTLLLAFPFSAFAKKGDGSSPQKPKLTKTTANNPAQSLIDINNITCWVSQEGFHDWVVGGSWNGMFPNGVNAGAIFSEGIVWGGQVNDGNSPIVRVDGNTYSTGCSPIERLYRVRPDYATANDAALAQDVADFYSENVSDVTPDQIQTVRAQYAKDWNEWPADKGAPYKDSNGDGQYEPNIDTAGIPGASQTIFIMYNDNISSTLYGTPPIGLQVSETYWAYAASGPLANIIFKKVDIVYKGTSTSSSNAEIDSMYIVQWADPDVGNSTDDFAGCDTTLNLGYSYSSGYTDAVYQGLGLAPPAVGYDFLQGVSKFTGNPNDSAIFNLKYRKGYKYVNPKPMSSYAYFAAGGTWSDPDFTATGTNQFYNLMRGDLPRPPYPSAQPFPSSVADVTPYGTYLLDGDPVFGTGKIDGKVDGPGDRRIMVTNGPITMHLNDTAQVVLALVGGLGTNNISSISVLKYNDLTAQYAYDQLFNIPIMPSPKVQAFGLNDKVVLNWGQPQSLLNQIENSNHGIYNFQAYSVYQLPPGGTDITQGVRIATYDLKDQTTVLYNKELDEGTGLIISKPIVVLKNLGLQRYITITQDQIFNKPLANGLPYTFAVTAMAYNNDPTLPSNILESAPAIVNVTPQQPVPGTSYEQDGPIPASDISHTGTANASIDVSVINPDSVTGHQYEVSFHNEMYSLGADGKWVDITPPKKIGKVTDLTGSYLTSAASYSETKGLMDVHYTVNVISPNYDYCDGVEITLPSNVIIDTTYSPISNNDGSPIPFQINRTTNTIFYSVVNPDSLLSGDSTYRTQNGIFAGGEDIVVTVRPASVPMITHYTMFDDNWGDMNGYYGGFIDVSGIDTLKGPISNKIVTQKQWNVKDLTTGNVVVKNQTILNGQDIYAPQLYFQQNGIYGPGGSTQSFTPDVSATANPIADASIQIGINGSYDAPTTINSSSADVSLNGTTMYHSTSGPGVLNWHDANHSFEITDFTVYGFANGTAAGSDPDYGAGGGVPLSDINDLQQDYELRWTGILGDTTIGGTTVHITKSGGQLVTLFGASGYDLKDAPLNPNPGTDSPFLVRVPFEVWNVDKNEQVNLLFWDRSGDGTSAWNMDSRQYTWIVNTKYDPSAPLDPTGSAVSDSATWNVVIYASAFTLGDVVKLTYPNPLQVGADKFTFNTRALAYNKTQAKSDVNLINVFPNPYYGSQYRETARDDHYVTFSHLPKTATIRLFDLSGVLVRTIHHLPGSGQFEKWNLQNDSGYPVASGIYIAYIDMPDLGATKILKLAIVQEQQILQVY